MTTARLWYQCVPAGADALRKGRAAGWLLLAAAPLRCELVCTGGRAGGCDADALAPRPDTAAAAASLAALLRGGRGAASAAAAGCAAGADEACGLTLAAGGSRAKALPPCEPCAWLAPLAARSAAGAAPWLDVRPCGDKRTGDESDAR